MFHVDLPSHHSYSHFLAGSHPSASILPPTTPTIVLHATIVSNHRNWGTRHLFLQRGMDNIFSSASASFEAAEAAVTLLPPTASTYYRLDNRRGWAVRMAVDVSDFDLLCMHFDVKNQKNIPHMFAPPSPLILCSCQRWWFGWHQCRVGVLFYVYVYWRFVSTSVWISSYGEGNCLRFGWWIWWWDKPIQSSMILTWSLSSKYPDSDLCSSSKIHITINRWWFKERAAKVVSVGSGERRHNYQLNTPLVVHWSLQNNQARVEAT